MLWLIASVAAAAPPTPDELTRAEGLLGRKDYAGAEALLRQVIGSEPGNARAHGNLALALLPQKKVREAVAEGRLAAAFGPRSPEARYIYGMTLMADGRPLEAAREYEQAVALKPGEPGPLSALAGAYAAAEDARAVETYEKLIVLRPKDPRVRAQLAEYLWRAEKTSEGNAVMERAVAAFPSDADLVLRYGRALAQQERFVDAAAALETARRLQSIDAATFGLLAEAYRWANQVESARSALAAGIAAFPDDASLQHELGRLWLADGKPDVALPYLERAVRERPGAGDFQLDYGRAMEASGDLEGAEAAYRRAIQNSPQLPGAHFALGRLLQRKGKKEEAERELATHRALYERALQIVAQAQVNGSVTSLAWTELNAGKAAEALARFKALPESPDSLRGQALALQRLGRHAEAVGTLERARTLAPEDARLGLMLATERSRAAQAP